MISARHGLAAVLAIVTLIAVPPRSRTARADEPKDAARGRSLQPLAFEPLPLGEVRPSGWLANQLRIQAEGLSGHLDEFWPDIRNSAWTGGTAEGWERAPYWLDGIVPLAFLLDDDALKAKARRFIDYVLTHPHDDGWLGPLGDGKHEPYDPWPLFVLFKALTQYQEATGDPRVIPAMMKCARRMQEVIAEKPLKSWAKFRAADLVVSLNWLHDRTGEPWLLDLAAEALRQAHDWKAQTDDFTYAGKTAAHFDNLASHGVNNGMALKFAAVRYRLSGDENDREGVDRMLAVLDRHHGQASGIFTCDEHLAGRSPSQGTELCTVVEAMYAMEVDLAILGRPEFGDRLERLAFNALPATFKPDMSAHQYDQQANQVVCKVSPEHVYVNNDADANIFGLEPNFGCCTANMHQGWPKFASHLWMKSPDGGLAAVALAPSIVETRLGETPVRVSLETEYPFRDTLRFVVEPSRPSRFPLHVRIPSWARGATLAVADGEAEAVEAGSFHRVDRQWGVRTELVLKLPMRARLWDGLNGSVAILRGPLVFALKVDSEWRRIRRELPFADWEVHPTSPWNYALLIDRDDPSRSISFEERPVGDRPFSPSGAPVVGRAKGRRVPSWTMEKNAAAPPPRSPVETEGPREDLALIPYGCTDLRVTEFPTSGRE